MKNTRILLWTKFDMANMLGVNYYYLRKSIRLYAPDAMKKRDFTDVETFEIVKKISPILKDENIMALMYPKGIV
jgi:hypothetical protein